MTIETAKHRVFQFLPMTIVPDNMLAYLGSNDAFHLGVLSNRFHVLERRYRVAGWEGAFSSGL
ncbi:hypothetical protein PX699_30355 [Sphingobium sp. H39-3-25]|uniref:hypothetical protein n=1 Tax=Sphingobium arseniciresistens TaxID=3030834 RepID=UPI0023BA1D48|nr:hypothetical protein [Sphingobium arseniciresistens]